MKKFFVFAIALVASVLAFTACNSNDPQHPIKGYMFCCDNDSQSPYKDYARHYFYFGNKDDFEYGWKVFSDEARTQLQGTDYESGTYNLYDEYIDLNYTAGHYELMNQTFQPHSERVYYQYWEERETIVFTFNKGTDNEYRVYYYKAHE